MMGVYLLHFIPRFKHAGHYLGYADDIGRRVYEHEMGQSDVKLITAAVKAGVQFHLAQTWEGGDRTLERKLKGTKGPGRTGSLARLCPICKEERKKNVRTKNMAGHQKNSGGRSKMASPQQAITGTQPPGASGQSKDAPGFGKPGEGSPESPSSSEV